MEVINELFNGPFFPPDLFLGLSSRKTDSDWRVFGRVAIRFVKYSADEQNWLRRVGEKRDTELKWLLKTRINNLVSNGPLHSSS